MGIIGEPLMWQDCNRETAVIITNDGKLYEDINHQYCLDSFTKDYFPNMSFEDDIDEMVAITDCLFRKGEFHGFDVFIGKDKKYLAAHYPVAYSYPKIRKAAEEYALKNGCILTTFTSTEKLGKEMKAIA